MGELDVKLNPLALQSAAFHFAHVSVTVMFREGVTLRYTEDHNTEEQFNISTSMITYNLMYCTLLLTYHAVKSTFRNNEC